MNHPRTFWKLLLFCSLVQLCLSCGQQQPSLESAWDSVNIVKPEYPIHIRLSGEAEYKNTLTLTDLATDVRYIPLETHKDGLIGRRHSLPQFAGEYIFIETMGRLMEFDQQGKFIRRIGRMGNGPKECTVWDYGIDEKDGLVYIFDFMKKSVLMFNFEGEYVKTIRNPFSGASDIAFADHMVYDERKGNLLFSFNNNIGNMKYKYVIADTTGKILHKCPNFTKYHLKRPISSFSFSYSLPLYRYDSAYYYEDRFNDTVFVINKDYSCSPAYIRSLPNRMTLKDDLELSAEVITLEDLSGRNNYGDIREDDKYVYLYHSRQQSKGYISLLSLFKKQAGTIIENINPLIINNLDGGMDVTLGVYWQDENHICLFLQSSDMKETLTPEHFASLNIAHPEKAEALKKLVSTLKDEDNPVLMIITMK